MKHWPSHGHEFQIWRLVIEQIFMLRWFGGIETMDADQFMMTGFNFDFF